MTEGRWFPAWRAVVQRELAMGMRQKGEVLTPLRSEEHTSELQSQR